MKIKSSIRPNYICKLSILFVILFNSCSKFVEIPPPITSINGEIVFQDDATAIAAVTGLYANLSKANVTDGGYPVSVFFRTGLMGDELMLYDDVNSNFASLYHNSLKPSTESWYDSYNALFVINSAISELNKNQNLTPAVRKQLLGETKFMRAFYFFYLVNYYGDIPMPLTTDYKVNRLLPRTSKNVVYEQIKNDLNEAKDLLSEYYLDKFLTSVTTERTRPSRSAASSLLARVYLYTKQYNEAEKEATKVILRTSDFELVSLDNVFLKNSKEAIWQLQSVSTPEYANTKEGELLRLLDLPDDFTRPVYLRSSLVESFDPLDQRKIRWIGKVTDNSSGGEPIDYFFAYKYKVGVEGGPTIEYSTVLRLAELYLIRAEARIQTNNLIGGISDLNILRNRATNLSAPLLERLPQLSNVLSKQECLIALENERKFELFTEWGHRWFDLVRTNGLINPQISRANEVLGVLKAGDWQPTDELFPIPEAEVNGSNPNMAGKQNPGY